MQTFFVPEWILEDLDPTQTAISPEASRISIFRWFKQVTAADPETETCEPPSLTHCPEIVPAFHRFATL
jgi:hypothetical protein